MSVKKHDKLARYYMYKRNRVIDYLRFLVKDLFEIISVKAGETG
jgi:hypothetical protein